MLLRENQASGVAVSGLFDLRCGINPGLVDEVCMISSHVIPSRAHTPFSTLFLQLVLLASSNFRGPSRASDLQSNARFGSSWLVLAVSPRLSVSAVVSRAL